MCLIDLAGLTTDELMREIERMKHERVSKYYPSTLTPAASGEATSLPCAESGAAGTYQCNTTQTTRI